MHRSPYERVRVAAWLTPILAVALALRLVGIDFGLPHALARPDETTVIRASLELLRSGSPRFFNYPSLYPTVLAGVLGARYAVARAVGHFAGPDDLIAEWTVEPGHLLLLNRVVSACFGTGTIVVIYLLASRLWNRGTGLIASAFLAVAYLHVRESHLGTVDATLTFFCMLALLAMERTHSLGRTRSVLLAGVCTGLAISVKYNGATLLLPLLIACVTAHNAGPGPTSLGTVARRLSLCALAVAAGFLIGTPYVLWDWTTFRHDLVFELTSKLGGQPHAGVDGGGRGWVQHLRISLWYGIGFPMLLAAVVGLFAVLRRRRFQGVLLSAFGVGWWALTGASLTVFVRYALPLVPLACIFAAIGVTWLTHRWQGRRAVAVAVTAVAIIGAIPAWNSVQFVVLMNRPDNRLVAGGWIREHVAAGQEIGLVGDQAAHPYLFSVADQVRAAREFYLAQHGGRGVGFARLAEYVQQATIPTYHRYKTAEGSQCWVDYYTEQPVPDAKPPVIVVPDYPVYEAYIRAGWGDWLAGQLARDYRQVHESATMDLATERVFDRQDLLFLPFAGFQGIDCPGPSYRAYVRCDIPTFSGAGAN
jgi:4-amino-4-deoxy-L-arabinose transferase-like glycosyltransferase